ncbi:uncharacterized protein LOC133193610 [Saccostrea echinata]|uniref:uncharacterized protein LOC133193610 n=1 Tax=Saccostrea echinata TaxID=191078 RepID=UPI002A7F2272|nr:uncharacterized protein LOC133193610 [Saccostrea echinata]
MECREGYTKTGGDGRVKCLPNGRWSDVNLQCVDEKLRYKCIKRPSSTRKYRWQGGKNKCEGLGGYLAEIESLREWELIKKIKSENCSGSLGPWWIGGKDRKWIRSGQAIDHSFIQWINRDNQGQCLLVVEEGWKFFECTAGDKDIICEKDGVF